MPTPPIVTSRSRPTCLHGLGLAALAATALSGCLIVDDHHDGVVYVDDDGGEPAGEIFTVGIDEGATLEAEPGQGVGLYVELLAPGEYFVWTTCDTDASGYACGWDVYLSGNGVGDVWEEGLEGSDFTSSDGDQVYAYLETSSDTDGFSFLSDAGATVRLEVYLDGYSEPRFVYWVADGVLQRGAPSNPVDFAP